MKVVGEPQAEVDSFQTRTVVGRAVRVAAIVVLFAKGSEVLVPGPGEGERWSLEFLLEYFEEVFL